MSNLGSSNQLGSQSGATANASFLNNSAPVSSLLPQIAAPSAGTPSLLNGHQAASLQAQLASLLTQGGLTSGLAVPHHHAAISAHSQLVASQAAPTLLSSTANMQDFTLEQLGES